MLTRTACPSCRRSVRRRGSPPTEHRSSSHRASMDDRRRGDAPDGHRRRDDALADTADRGRRSRRRTPTAPVRAGVHGSRVVSRPVGPGAVPWWDGERWTSSKAAVDRAGQLAHASRSPATPDAPPDPGLRPPPRTAPSLLACRYLAAPVPTSHGRSAGRGPWPSPLGRARRATRFYPPATRRPSRRCVMPAAVRAGRDPVRGRSSPSGRHRRMEAARIRFRGSPVLCPRPSRRTAWRSSAVSRPRPPSGDRRGRAQGGRRDRSTLAARRSPVLGTARRSVSSPPGGSVRTRRGAGTKRLITHGHDDGHAEQGEDDHHRRTPLVVRRRARSLPCRRRRRRCRRRRSR